MNDPYPQNDQQKDSLSDEFDEIVQSQKPETTLPATQPLKSETTETTSRPVSEAGNPVVVQENQNTPGVLVLQWLTYAFWGWFALSMLWLVAICASWLVVGKEITGSVSESLPYPLAASLVLLVISLAVDFAYRRVEPVKKTGAASIIMIIHGVIFALCAIGALITALFALIYSAMNAGSFGGEDGPKVALIVSLVMFVIYLALLARTMYGATRRKITASVWALMVALFLVTTIVGLAGPAAWSIATKQDRLIEEALPSLATEIRNYAEENEKLPDNLSDLRDNLSSYRKEKVETLIDSNAVRYTKKSNPLLTRPSSPASKPSTGISVQEQTRLDRLSSSTMYYELCVTYKHEKKSTSRVTRTTRDNEPATYLYIYSHPAGEQCYDMMVR